MRPLPLLLTAVLCLLGCPKRVESRVAGSADEQMDAWAAELEELRSRASAPGATQADSCGVVDRACALAEQVCQFAARHPDRDDFQRQCGRAQEDCAHDRDVCSRSR